MKKEDKIQFIMAKCIDFKIDALDYDGMRDVVEDALMVTESEIAIQFRDWCINKQQPYVRNGYQDMSTEELWKEYNSKALTN